jgi:hypothetical protein
VARSQLIHDLKLAEALGMPSDRLRDIRPLIKRNMEEVQLHGSSRFKTAMVPIGSSAEREVTEYWLTEAQAYVAAGIQRAERAACQQDAGSRTSGGIVNGGQDRYRIR